MFLIKVSNLCLNLIVPLLVPPAGVVVVGEERGAHLTVRPSLLPAGPSLQSPDYGAGALLTSASDRDQPETLGSYTTPHWVGRQFKAKNKIEKFKFKLSCFPIN